MNHCVVHLKLILIKYSKSTVPPLKGKKELSVLLFFFKERILLTAALKKKTHVFILKVVFGTE